MTCQMLRFFMSKCTEIALNAHARKANYMAR